VSWWPTTKGVGKPPGPEVRGTALDPAGSGGGVGGRSADHNEPDLAVF